MTNIKDGPTTLDFNEVGGNGVVVASAGPYANRLQGRPLYFAAVVSIFFLSNFFPHLF